ncbi:MAG: hypothetical protein HYV90_05965 [Candidatus Woesebacteria bacterium]|nr:MAG: hypothetical protein HYV90_05965 [Candidatus Woesebacteria bacterium]
MQYRNGSLPLILAAAILFIASLGFIRLEHKQYELDKLAKWNSFLNQVPTGSGMILTRNLDSIELGQKYKIPINDSDEVIVVDNGTAVLSPMHHYALEAEAWPIAKIPGRLWYADEDGNILGSYKFESGGPDDLFVYLSPDDVPNCEYRNVVKVETYSLESGLTFVQIWTKGESFSYGCDF